MHRFYLPVPDIAGDMLTIADPALMHQLTKVLRGRVGDRVLFFGHAGATELIAEYVDITKHSITARIVEQRHNQSEPTHIITLYQALPKQQSRFEEILQHGTEIGISHFVPIISARTEAYTLRNLPRLQKIITEATEQSNRTCVPTLSEPVTFDQALKTAVGTHIIGDSFGTPPLLSTLLPTLRTAQEAGVWIGPEGGFTATEIEHAKKAGIAPISLGPRILRLETAGIAIASAILLG